MKSKESKASLPSNVSIELCNICDSRCTTCPNKILKRKKEIMDFNLFKKIIDELKAKDYSGDISPFFLGEPLLVPNLFEYLRYIKKNVPNAFVRFFTNGFKLTPDISSVLIKEHLIGRLVISFDGGTKEAYEAIRVGLDFDVVRNNIHEFIKIRNNEGKTYPKVEISMVVTKSNKKTISDLRNEFKDADDVTFHKYFEASVPGTKKWVYNPNPKISKLKGFFTKRNFCFSLEYDAMICSNGIMVPCCADYEATVPLGNLKNNTIEELWNGEKLNQIRDDLKHRRFDKLPMCANCDLIEQNIIYRPLLRIEKRLRKFPLLFKIIQTHYAKKVNSTV